MNFARKRSDRPLILVLSMLVISQGLWLAHHLGWLSSSAERFSEERVWAGRVLKADKDVKLRKPTSLIWTSAAEGDALYYFDSVLTLSQSTARLYLHEKTEVLLSENTLITIEPLSTADYGTIRLKFNRGDLRARNPFQTARIETESLTLDLKTGSEIALNGSADKEFEVEVLSGEAKLTKDSEELALQTNEVVRFNNEVLTERKKLDRELQWKVQAPTRIYAHEDEIKIPLQWNGRAQKLRITNSQGESEIQQIADSNQVELTLPLGKTQFRLETEIAVSSALEVEVWKAPKIHLLAPYPRDRLNPLNSVQFEWTENQAVAKYKIRILNPDTKQEWTEIISSPEFQHQFTGDGDYLWSVEGIDRDGFKIPAAYDQSLYLREEALEAPTLKSPRLRAPSAAPKNPKPEPAVDPTPENLDGVFWFFLREAFGQRVSANVDVFEAIFEWDPVKDADHYILEISRDPQFRELIVSEKLNRTLYSWAQFQLGTYYWRVAAGSRSGKLGRFSESQRVDLQTLPVEENIQSGIIVRKKKETPPPRAVVDTSDDRVLTDLPKKTFDETRFEKDLPIPFSEYREQLGRYLVEIGQVQSQYKLESADSLSLTADSESQAYFRYIMEQHWKGDRSYVVDLYYSPQKWVADKQKYPFQDEATWTEYSLQILTGSRKDRWSFGFHLSSWPEVQRKDFEQVDIKEQTSVGLGLLWMSPENQPWMRTHQASLSVVSTGFKVQSQNTVAYRFWKGLSLGIRLQGAVFFQNQETSSQVSGGALLSWDHP
jgi:hypothetical protein